MLSKSSLCGYVEEKRSHTLRAVTLTATATFRILLRIVPLWARASGLPASPYRRMISSSVPANTEKYIRSWFARIVAVDVRSANRYVLNEVCNNRIVFSRPFRVPRVLHVFPR